MSKGKVVRLDGDTCMWLDLLSSKIKSEVPDYLKNSVSDNLVIKIAIKDKFKDMEVKNEFT